MSQSILRFQKLNLLYFLSQPKNQFDQQIHNCHSRQYLLLFFLTSEKKLVYERQREDFRNSLFRENTEINDGY